MSLVNNSEVLSLLAPITPENPVGHFNEEDEIYTALEDEMIKLGGLQHGSIDWEQVEKNSKLFLQAQCKHFRIAGYLIQCWLRQETWASWCNACDLLAGFCETYFNNSFPKPGKTGLTLKRKMLSMLLERFKSSMDSLINAPKDKESLSTALLFISRVQEIGKTIDLSKEDLSITTGIQQKLDRALKAPPASPNKPAISTEQTQGNAINNNFFAQAQNLSSSMTNERELRKALFTIAQSANQHDAYDPVGYLLRRYALWGPITSSPITVKGNQTELMPVPTSIVEEYQIALESNRVDPALLQKVENSVMSSVYWFKGSYFAFQYAKQLEMDEVANAIWSATSRFVTRLPILLKLQFSDGSPFSDDITSEWLSTPLTPTPQSQVATQQIDTDYLKLQKKLSKQMEEEGVESVLRTLEKHANNTTSPRSLCQFMKITADLLNEQGLKWLANDIYQRIEQSMTTTYAAQWEPELFTQICAATNQREQSNNKQESKKGEHQP